MSKKVYKRVNKYNGGSWISKNAGGVAAALGGAATLVSDLQGALAGNQEAINNTKAGINQVNNTTFNAGNTSSLMSQWSSANYADPVTSKQFRSDKGALGILTGAASGASAGASLGPWGALAGAAAGIGTGLAGWLGGKAKNKKRANKFNAEIKSANNRLNKNFQTARDNLEEEQINNALMNYAAYGGPLESNGITWPSQLMFVNNGDTHENNPNEGVQIGIDSKGIPNLVEEGEVIYNDYVFSNRLKVPKKDRKKFKLGNKEIAYSDAVEKFAKESEERPNDVISRRGLEASLNKLIDSQEAVRNKKSLGNKFAYGSYMDYPPVSYSKYSPYSNVSDTQSSDSKWFTFDANNPRNITKYSDEYKNYNFTAKDAIEWAKKNPNDASLKDFLAKGNTLDSLTDDYVSTHSLDNVYGWLHEARRDAVESKNAPIEIPESGPVPKTGLVQPLSSSLENAKRHIENTRQEIFENQKINNNSNNKNDSWNSYLRYAPILGNVLGLLSGGEDYSNTDLMSRYIDNLPTIDFNSIGNYLEYNPFDMDYHANRLNAQSSATRRSILNNSYGNIGMANAALLAADLNAQTSIGDIYRQAAEYNQGLKERVAAFNRGTNQFNSQLGLQADMANADLQQAALNSRMKELTMREDIRRNSANSRNINLTSLFDNLGAIGKEEATKEMLNNNPALLYEVLTGKYKGNSSACGGKLNRRRK